MANKQERGTCRGCGAKLGLIGNCKNPNCRLYKKGTQQTIRGGTEDHRG